MTGWEWFGLGLLLTAEAAKAVCLIVMADCWIRMKVREEERALRR